LVNALFESINLQVDEMTSLCFAGEAAGAEVQDLRQADQDRLRAEEQVEGQVRNGQSFPRQEDGPGTGKMGKHAFFGIQSY
jgi:hypothetical protein